MRRPLFAAVALVCFATGIVSAATPIEGTFALQGGRAQTNAHMLASQIGGDALDRHFEFWLTWPNSDRPIRSYEIDMTQYLHLIVVSDDFRTFLHLHPQLQADGHFVLDQRLPRSTGYYIYADMQPQGIGQQVFRFDLQVGGANGAPDLRPTGTAVDAGPYRVTISTDRFKAAEATALVVHITEDGAAAKNLHPYLGALAHAVFLNAATLDYLHVHPTALSNDDAAMAMNMKKAIPALNPASTSSPDMQLRLALATPGLYRLWLQFRGGDHMYAASFVIWAR